MKKHEITIIIPLVGNISDSKILPSFLESALRNKIYVQFVFLLNSKKAKIKQQKSKYNKYNDYEVLIVPNDRYFGTCEENIYRSQDFSDIFKPLVFCIGEHDFIEWSNLLGAIDFFLKNNLDALAWNIVGDQLCSDGTYYSLHGITDLNSNLLANKYMRMMLSGEVLSSRIGSTAILSLYGPIDWFAYLGCHLFSKEVFSGILQYNLAEESVYSLVYKQLIYFQEQEIRYSFYNTSVIHRVSNEFLNIKLGKYSRGWLEDHRTSKGASPVFWIANIKYLSHLSDQNFFKLFDIILFSFTLKQISTEDERACYKQVSMLENIFKWIRMSIQNKLSGRSHYFPEFCGSSSLIDIRYIKEFLDALIEGITMRQKVYYFLPKSLSQIIIDLSGLIDLFLKKPSISSDFLGIAKNKIDECMYLIQYDFIAELNNNAFSALIDGCIFSP